MRRSAAALIALLAWASPAVAETPAQEAYVVDVRDVLEILVYGEPGLSGTVIVAEGGVIDVQLLGPIHIAGLSALDIADLLERKFDERNLLVNPQVTVRVSSYASKEIDIIGAVRNPGLYYLSGPTTLMDLLSKAGGFSKDNVSEVHVDHEDGTRTVVKREDLSGGGSAGGLLMQKGDSIRVPEGLVVYVGGEVARPGEVGYKDGLTITEAITLAGSWKPTAMKTSVYILRDGQRMRVNVRRILRAKDADILLLPGDQVQVPESAI